MAQLSLTVECPQCHATSKAAWPMTFATRDRYFECLDCGHVWKVTPPQLVSRPLPSLPRKSAR